MSKHTPGPWTRGWGNFVYQGAKFNPRQMGRHIATCEPTTRTQQDWDQVFANARLIAAAPDLLKALEYILQWGHCPEADDKARAAIAKATEGP